MIDHLGINCADLETSKRFYDAVLGVLGYSRQMDFGVAVGYGPDGKPDFWLSRYDDMPPNREVHVAVPGDRCGSGACVPRGGGRRRRREPA